MTRSMLVLGVSQLANLDLAHLSLAKLGLMGVQLAPERRL